MPPKKINLTDVVAATSDGRNMKLRSPSTWRPAKIHTPEPAVKKNDQPAKPPKKPSAAVTTPNKKADTLIEKKKVRVEVSEEPPTNPSNEVLNNDSPNEEQPANPSNEDPPANPSNEVLNNDSPNEEQLANPSNEDPPANPSQVPNNADYTDENTEEIEELPLSGASNHALEEEIIRAKEEAAEKDAEFEDRLKAIEEMLQRGGGGGTGISGRL
ncbi:hypothetical protein QQ045_025977 [Rhodiola kirilowii]